MKNFIPDLIAEKASMNILSGTFAASTMFVDISGFTSMTRSLMKQGKEGAEVLSNIINSIFTPAIRAIYDNGGFVSTFAGDAFTAVFESDADYALNAAFEINKLFVDAGNINTKFGEFELAVKIGLSHGEVEFGIIDTEVQKAYYFRGEAIDGCAKAEHHADRMEIVADGKFMEKLSVEAEKQPAGENHFVITPQELCLSPLKNKTETDQPEIEKMFVPDSVLEMKDRGEFREIVSVFIGFEETAGFEKPIAEVIRRTHAYGGYFNKIDFGDKGGVMLVIFGAPTGREKLYSRAADFALSLKEIPEFSFRAGVSTGIAFCGIVGSDLRKEYTALGDVVNLSARLMTKAGPNSIFAGPDITAKLPASYRYESKGLTEFKGFSEKLEVFELKGKTSTTLKMSYSGSFVGRKKEADELIKMIQPIFDNKFGGIIYIDGPAGIGKSRFIDNFVGSLEDCVYFYLPCDEILRKSFNPFEYFFKNYFGQSESATKEENKTIFSDKYSELVSSTKDKEIQSELLRTESVIGALIGLEWENSLYSQLDAKGRYENTLYAVKHFFLAQSLIKPVVLVLEDAHWADNDSIELFKILTRNVSRYPFILLALCRPNDDGSVFSLFDSDKAEIPLDRLSIEPFNKDIMNELLKDRFSAENIPDKTSDFVWEKSNGNPFFVEQLALYLTENNLLDSSMNIISEASSIPSGISQIIIARIDRLSSQMKKTVKTASVLGREFALKVLERMLGSETGLKDINILNELETGKNDKLWENLTELKYIFKHALIRETVYEIQLKETLRNLHDLAGTIIEDLYKDDLKTHYDELADHYDKAENRVKAIEYLEKAGDKAKESYKNERALIYFNKLIPYLKDQKDDERTVIYLERKGEILELTGKWKDSEDAYRESLELSEKTENLKLRIDCMNNLGFLMKEKGEVKETEKLLLSALEMSERIGYKTGVFTSAGNIGMLRSDTGDYKAALELYQKWLDVCTETGDKKEISKALLNIGNTHYFQGNYDKALEFYNRQLINCEQTGDIRAKSYAIGNIGLVYMEKGDYITAVEYFERSLPMVKELGDKRAVGRAIGNIGLTALYQTDYDKALKNFFDVYELFIEVGDKRSAALAVLNIGNVYYNRGELEKAMKNFEELLSISIQIEDKRGMSYAHGNIGNIHQDRSDLDKALKHYEAKLNICRELNDKRDTACVYGNIGNLLKKKGDYDTAMKYYEKETDLSTEIEDKNEIARSYGNTADLFRILSKYDKASDLFRKMLSICESIGDKKGCCTAHSGIGSVYKDTGDYEESLKHYDIAEAIASNNKLNAKLCDILYAKSDLMQKTGKIAEAEILKKEADNISENIFSKTE